MSECLFQKSGGNKPIWLFVLDVSLECPVCKDVFKLDEEVKKLPCKHYFHEGCITPWLKKVSNQYIL